MASFLDGFHDITLLAVLRDECSFGPLVLVSMIPRRQAEYFKMQELSVL